MSGVRLRWLRHTLPALALAACGDAATTETAGPDQLSLADCGVDATERERLLSLDEDAFDQDFDGGWRAVSLRHDGACKVAAAQLLDDYIERHDVSPDTSVMHWHVGQMLAGAGRYTEARPWFEAERRTGQLDSHDEAWNLYVDGTLAFLDSDRAAFERASAELNSGRFDPTSEEAASMREWAESENITFPEESYIRNANGVVLERMLACWGTPYSEAYGGRCERPLD